MSDANYVSRCISVEQIPIELRRREQWVVWRYEAGEKVPYVPSTGRRAKPNDPRTWTSFETARETLEESRGHFDGLGFMFLPDDELCGVDLDDCYDRNTGELLPLVAAIVESHRGYWERSPSGNGLKGWFRDPSDGFFDRRPLWATKPSLGVELYNRRRFFTVTTWTLAETTSKITLLSEDLQHDLARLAAANQLASHMGESNRHWPIGALAGWLLKNGWPDDEVRTFTLHVAIANGGDLVDQLRFVESSIEKHRDGGGDDVAGYLSLIEHVDEHVVRKVASWLGIDSSQRVPNLEHNDIANAERFVGSHGDEIRFCIDEGCWYIYDGKRWLADSGATRVRNLAHESVKRFAHDAASLSGPAAQDALRWAAVSHDARRIDALMKSATAHPSIGVERKEFDANPDLLNTPSGTIDLRDGDVRAHDPDDLITKSTNYPVDFTMETPTFDRFLAHIFPGDRLLAYVHRAVGSSLVAKTEKVMYVCQGPSNTGKTTFLTKILVSMVGDYAADIEKQAISSAPGGSAEYYRVPLVGARMAVISEPDVDFGINAAFVKNATGGNEQHARQIYGRPVRFTPTATLWVDTNFEPKADHDDDALWNRLKYIPFKRPVPHKPDHQGYIEDFEQRLDAEMSGILAWAVKGCLTWREQGIEAPQEVVEATQRSRAEQDPLAEFFDTHLEAGDDYWSPRASVYMMYQEWSYALPRDERMNQRAFNKAMENRGFVKGTRRDDGKPVKVWQGCQLCVRPDDGRDAFDEEITLQPWADNGHSTSSTFRDDEV